MAQTVKASAYKAGDPGSIPGLGRSPGEGNGNPLQFSCLEKSHGQRSLAGYSPWGCKESDTTERLHFTSVVKNPPANAEDVRDAGLIPFRKIPWRREWQLTPVFLPGESHGQRSVVAYCP